MIDLHSHILPGIDDGAETLDIALDMARIAVADGTTVLACTPHIQEGVYDNSADTILPAIAALQAELDANGISLQLVAGADAHISPALPQRLKAGEIPTLGGGKYFLFEPPHHVCPPHVPDLVKLLFQAGYIPVLTHPERLTWIERDYDLITQLDDMGVAIQVTAASLTGRFGSNASKWALRLLDEGRIDIIASDAHSPKHRPPGLSKAYDLIANRVGVAAADRLTKINPQVILDSGTLPPKEKPANIVENRPKPERKKRGFFGKLFQS